MDTSPTTTQDLYDLIEEGFLIDDDRTDTVWFVIQKRIGHKRVRVMLDLADEMVYVYVFNTDGRNNTSLDYDMKFATRTPASVTLATVRAIVASLAPVEA